MYDKHYVGLDLTGFENNGTLDKVSRITLLVDDENAVTAGDDTGMELVADCPHATQAIANALLSQLKGYQYRMYGADSANIDPAAELGDGATVGGVYSVISSIEDDGSGYMGLAAPGEAEEVDEFPGSGPMTKEFNRKLATVRSSITKTAEQIRLEIKDEINGVNNSIDASLKGIKLEFSKTYLTQTDAASTYQTAQQVKSAIELSENGIALEYLKKTDAANTYRTEAQVKSAITAGINGIALEATNGEKSSTIKLKSGSVEISSQEIKFTGNVVFASDLSTAGSTTINGANIKTGTIAAERLNLSGAITWDAFDQDVEDYIDEAYDWAESANETIGNWGYVYKGNTYIDGAQIMTGTVTASTLQGGEINLLDADMEKVATFTLNAADTADYKLDIKADALAIVTDPGNLYFSASGSAFVQIKPGRVEIGGGMLRPVEDNELQLGNSSYRLEEIYCVNDVIQTSDREKKKDIEYGLSRYDAFFDRLTACSYRMVDGHERKHWGFVAQDIEQLLSELGIDSMDIAAFIKSPREDNENEFDYGLRYGEFTALIVEQIQNLKKRVKALEEAA